MKEKFFGRRQYIEILEKRIKGLKDGYRQNIAFLGDELVGKTSLIHSFLNGFVDNRFIFVFIEARPESLANFGKRFIGTLLYNFLHASQMPLKEDLDFLINKSSSYIPKTAEKIKSVINDLSRRKKENVFTQLLSLTESIHQETGKFCVVIVDEFLNLEQLGVKDIYKEWSQVLMLQKNTMCVVVSSTQFKAKNILSKDLSLLFGNFELIIVEPFDIKASEEYLSDRLSSERVNAGIKNFIVNFTGGYPFYLEIISDALAKSEDSDLSDILESLLFSSSGILNQRFTNSLKRYSDSSLSRDYTSVLYLIANGQNKARDIAHILHKPKKEVDARINYLLETDSISRSGDFLKVNDRVFGFWLKFVYQGKLQALTFDSVNQKLVFRKNIEAAIQEFLSHAQKPVSERITEVLRLFSDERIQLERKKLRLNHFREIKPLEFNNRGLRDGLICRSNESIWIFGFKYGLLTEEDVSEFSRECKKYRNKLSRKIIITLQDIDANSRLKALEEKVWTWDLNNLNQVMDLFSKPRIIA
jgi:hypothetical protein